MTGHERPFALRLQEALAQIERNKANPPPVVLEGFDHFAERQRLDAAYVDPIPPIPGADDRL